MRLRFSWKYGIVLPVLAPQRVHKTPIIDTEKTKRSTGFSEFSFRSIFSCSQVFSLFRLRKKSMGESKKRTSNSSVNGTRKPIATADIIANNMFKNRKLNGRARFFSKNPNFRLMAREINTAYTAKNGSPIQGERKNTK